MTFTNCFDTIGKEKLIIYSSFYLRPVVHGKTKGFRLYMTDIYLNDNIHAVIALLKIII